MSNKGTETALKQEINLNIIPNNQQQLITGAKLNVVLLDMVDTLMYLLGNGSGGAANYENLYNKPSINGYELNGEISLSALGLISSADIALAYQKKITESNKLAADYISGLSKVAFTGDYNDLINKPEISGGEVSNVSWGEQTATSATLIVEGVGKTLLTPQALDNYVQASTLFENGVIRSTLLPSYVDDVLEYTSRSNFPSTGQAGKIYVALDTNKTYRWGGSTYVVISETIAIGTTAGTAYDGAAGKALADAVAGIPNYYYNKTEIDDILLGYVDNAQIVSYYNKIEVDNKLKGYVTNTAFADAIDDYLTITDAENTYYKKTGGIISGGVTINGATTINNSLSVNSLKIGGISISVNSDGILFVEGTLATSGGLSVRGVSTGSGGGGSASLPAVWESLSGDKDEYKSVQINKSHLTAYLTATEVATSYATRGSLAALDERVTEIESSSTSVSYTPSVTSGQLLGTIVIDGKGSAIYAPALPTLAAVATSGSYNDLSNKPSIPSIAGLASESWVSNNFLGLGGGIISRTDRKQLLLTNPNSDGISALWIGGEFEFFHYGGQVAYERSNNMLYISNYAAYINNAIGVSALRITADNKVQVGDANWTAGHIYDILHSGNIGSYKAGYAGDADKLGGYGITQVLPQILQSYRYIDAGVDLDILTHENAGWWNSIDNTTYPNGPMQNFGLLSARINSSYFGQLAFGYNSSMLKYRSQRYDSGYIRWGDWRQIAFIDSNVAGAYALVDANGTTIMSTDIYGNIHSDGSITLTQAAGNAATDYISAGGGYSPTSGKYGVKIICCDQNDCQTGLGQDLTNLSGGYELSVAGGTSASGYGYISFCTHAVNSTTYTRLGYFYNNYGSISFNVEGNITASGTIAGRSISVTSVNQSSDKRLKREESRSTPLTIEDIAQLNVRSYKWIDESMGKELQIGLYAQDVQTIIPEIVRENEQSKSLGLDYGVGGAVFGVLAAQSIVKQIKPALTEQQKRIIELEQRVEFLEKIAYGCK